MATQMPTTRSCCHSKIVLTTHMLFYFGLPFPRPGHVPMATQMPAMRSNCNCTTLLITHVLCFCLADRCPGLETRQWPLKMPTMKVSPAHDPINHSHVVSASACLPPGLDLRQWPLKCQPLLLQLQDLANHSRVVFLLWPTSAQAWTGSNGHANANHERLTRAQSFLPLICCLYFGLTFPRPGQAPIAPRSALYAQLLQLHDLAKHSCIVFSALDHPCPGLDMRQWPLKMPTMLRCHQSTILPSTLTLVLLRPTTSQAYGVVQCNASQKSCQGRTLKVGRTKSWQFGI
jgi:hypothetical protein